MKKPQFLSSALRAASVALGSSMLVMGAMTLSAPANAATFACPSSVADDVTGTTACERSDSATQDFLNTNPMTVNAEAFFDFSDWSFGGKIGEDAGYAGVGSGQSGTWNISSVVQSTWSDIMLVFKSGQGTTLTGYLLADGVTSGNWSSPFAEVGPRGQIRTKDNSHISVYFRQGENPPPPPETVPEPSMMVGLAVAGATFAASRRRKSANA